MFKLALEALYVVDAKSVAQQSKSLLLTIGEILTFLLGFENNRGVFVVIL